MSWLLPMSWIINQLSPLIHLGILHSSVVAQITTQPQLVVADPNGNHDSGYAASNVDDVLAGVGVAAGSNAPASASSFSAAAISAAPASSGSPPDSPLPSGATLQRSSVSSRRNTADDSPKRGEPALRSVGVDNSRYLAFQLQVARVSRAVLPPESPSSTQSHLEAPITFPLHLPKLESLESHK